MKSIESPKTQVWEAVIDASSYSLGGGVYVLRVEAENTEGRVASDEIRVSVGKRARYQRQDRDQDNPLQAWPEHGLLGTQLGPNKNGKKW